jgi:hypothetical protein
MVTLGEDETLVEQNARQDVPANAFALTFVGTLEGVRVEFVDGSTFTLPMESASLYPPAKLLAKVSEEVQRSIEDDVYQLIRLLLRADTWGDLDERHAILERLIDSPLTAAAALLMISKLTGDLWKMQYEARNADVSVEEIIGSFDVALAARKMRGEKQ